MLSLTKSTKDSAKGHFVFSIDTFNFDFSAVSCKQSYAKGIFQVLKC